MGELGGAGEIGRLILGKGLESAKCFWRFFGMSFGVLVNVAPCLLFLLRVKSCSSFCSKGARNNGLFYFS